MSIYKAELKTRKIQDWTLAACPNIEKNLKWKHKEWKKLKMRKIKPVPVVHILRRIKNERIEKWDKTKIRKIEPVLLVHISENLTLWTAQIYAGLQAESTNNHETFFFFFASNSQKIYTCMSQEGLQLMLQRKGRKPQSQQSQPTFPFSTSHFQLFTADLLFDQAASILKHWDL